MNQRDRLTLTDLLLDLMIAQDCVTHYNESGDTARCSLARLDRDASRMRIVVFVENLVPEVAALLEATLEVLRRVEWVSDYPDSEWRQCPVCLNWKADGHEYGCEMAAVLAAWE